mmetsp:Transcript_30249/g.90067  ORF Transcript_30249/g.90067 Transcript_30249/m.90067 type:complete len:116 (+) Transcript_30249:980-1327(+)
MRERFIDWASSVAEQDPRSRIQRFFDDLARDGGVERLKGKTGPEDAPAASSEGLDGVSLVSLDLEEASEEKKEEKENDADDMSNSDIKANCSSRMTRGASAAILRSSAVLHPELQ